MDSKTKAVLRKVRTIKELGGNLDTTSELEALITGLPYPDEIASYGLKPKEAYAAEGLVRWAWSFVNVNFKRFIAEDPLVSVKDKLRLLRLAKEVDPEMFGELIFHLKDVWAFTKESQLDRLAKLYLEMIETDEFDSRYCLDLAICLFERSYFDEYSRAFAHIIEARLGDSPSRPTPEAIIEACKYLLVQDEIRYQSLAQEAFIELVETPTVVREVKPAEYESEWEDVDSDEDFSDDGALEASEDFLAASDEEPPAPEAPPKKTLEEKRVEWEAGHAERTTRKRLVLEARLREAASKAKYDLIDSFFVRARKKGRRGKPVFINYIKPRHQSKHLKPSDTVNILEFMAPVSMVFVLDDTNYVKQRIVAASNLLASGVFPQDVGKVRDFLEGLMMDSIVEENTRADAIDVLLMNAGSVAEDSRIRKVLIEVGMSAVSATSSRVQDRIRTIYNNSQNAHDRTIVDSVLDYLNRLEVDELNLLEYEDIVRLLDRPMRSLARETRYSVDAALYRIKIDRSIVGNRMHQASEVFSIVWAVIHQPGRLPEEVATLEKRLIEELADMGGTCAGGHINRLVGVLQGFGYEMTISVADQIVANYAGRMRAQLNLLPEEEMEAVNESMISTERERYLSWATDAFEQVRKELHQEFVGGKFASVATFNEATDEARKSWF